MPNIRIKDIPTTASATSSTDFIGIDGSANGTRKLNAFSPTFGGNLTVSGTGGITSSSVSPLLKATTSALGAVPKLTLENTNLGAWNVYLSGTDGGDFKIDQDSTNKFRIAFGTGNATLAGNLTVSGGTIKNEKDFGLSTVENIVSNTNATGFVATTFKINSSEVGKVIGNSSGLTLRNSVGGTADYVFGQTALTVPGNVTVSGTTGVTATDLTLGSSGPSVKASLSARAPRQGLVFNGAGSGFATMGSSLGTSSGTIDIVLDIPSSNPSVSCGVFTVGPNTSSANFGNTISSELRTDGKLWVTLTGSTANDYRRVESSSSLVSLFGGKKIRLTVVRDSSASTLTIYANGILLATTETTGGTAPAWSGSVTGTYFIDGGVSPSENYVGYHSLSGFYNRALSASEVVALYEAGAPAGADYNNAGTVPISNTFNNEHAKWIAVGAGTITDNSGYVTFVSPHGDGRVQTNTFAGVQGARYRIVFEYQKSASDAITVYNYGKPALATISTTGDGTWRSASAEFVYVAGGYGGNELALISNSSTNYRNLSITRLGLLLAPDAAQAGGGLTWYDTSGNAANITLPASGVSWNVPFGNNIAASGTNQNLTLNASGTGSILLGSNGVARGQIAGVNKNGSTGPASSGTTTNGIWRVSNVSNSLVLDVGLQGNASPYPGYIQVSDYSNLATSYPLSLNPNGGVVLVNTTANSGNGAIQLATHTTSAGGIGFGTDVALFHRATGVGLTLSSIGSTTPYFTLDANGTNVLDIFGLSSDVYFDQRVAGKSLFFRTNGATLALTLDSSQNARFAARVQLAKTDGAVRGVQFTNTDTTAEYGSLNYSTGSMRLFANSVPIVLSANNGTTDSLTIDSSSNATFAGTINQKASKISAINETSVSTTATDIAIATSVGGLYFVAGYNSSNGAQGSWLLLVRGTIVTTVSSDNNTGLTLTFSMSSGKLQAATSSGTALLTCTAITRT